MSNSIYVTRPFLPPLKEFITYMEKIWESRQLTNNGSFHKELEKQLCNYLGVNYISLFNNGTIALVVAIKALELKGEIITTPFSFVATTHAISWNSIKPVFVDINPNTCNLDPSKIEVAITDKTTGIIPVHVYGNPCDTSKIDSIAKDHKLKVIYDAAHAFGVNINGKSILNSGDLSVVSFHATKVFNTFEGGAIVSHTPEMKRRIDDLKNFSFQDEITVTGLGINGKMNEIQAAMGLLQLKYFQRNLEKRKSISIIYRKRLNRIYGINYLNVDNINYNYSYFPIFISKDKFGYSRDEVYDILKKNNIYCRRYFYPLIAKFYPYRDLPSSKFNNLPIAEKLSEQVLCLPIFQDLNTDDANRIIDILENL